MVLVLKLFSHSIFSLKLDTYLPSRHILTLHSVPQSRSHNKYFRMLQVITEKQMFLIIKCCVIAITHKMLCDIAIKFTSKVDLKNFKSEILRGSSSRFQTSESMCIRYISVNFRSSQESDSLSANKT